MKKAQQQNLDELLPKQNFAFQKGFSQSVSCIHQNQLAQDSKVLKYKVQTESCSKFGKAYQQITQKTIPSENESNSEAKLLILYPRDKKISSENYLLANHNQHTKASDLVKIDRRSLKIISQSKQMSRGKGQRRTLKQDKPKQILQLNFISKKRVNSIGSQQANQKASTIKKKNRQIQLQKQYPGFYYQLKQEIKYSDKRIKALRSESQKIRSIIFKSSSSLRQKNIKESIIDKRQNYYELDQASLKIKSSNRQNQQFSRLKPPQQNKELKNNKNSNRQRRLISLKGTYNLFRPEKKKLVLQDVQVNDSDQIREDYVAPQHTQQNQNQRSRQIPQNKSKSKSNRLLRAFSLPNININHSKSEIVVNRAIQFGNFICLTNGIRQMPIISSHTTFYLVYVGNGNNSRLIKQRIRQRPWWKLTENMNQANFVWTQQKNSKFLQAHKNKKIIDQQSQYKQKQQHSKNNFSKRNTSSCKQYRIFKIYSENNNSQQLQNQFKRFMLQNQYQSILKKQKDNQIRIQPHYSSIKIRTDNKSIFSDHSGNFKVHNHLTGNQQLCHKKLLFSNLKKYYQSKNLNPFQFIPETYHVKKSNDQQWRKFVNSFRKSKFAEKQQKNIWIVKPGQDTNQGCGIKVCESLQEIQAIVNQNKKQKRTFIIQKYLVPFLYRKRKFDIRCYVLVTYVNKIIKAYWYKQGYIRTSSKQYNTQNLSNKFVHLTNDAIQSKSEDYGKYEKGNKLSYATFQSYLSSMHDNFDFQNQVYQKMKTLAADAIAATFDKLHLSKGVGFQVFGLDFLIDQNFKPWLIQFNTNPCLKQPSSVLTNIIPIMIQNAFRIFLDPLFPSPPKFNTKNIKNSNLEKKLGQDYFKKNKFSLIFQSSMNQVKRQTQQQ